MDVDGSEDDDVIIVDGSASGGAAEGEEGVEEALQATTAGAAGGSRRRPREPDDDEDGDAEGEQRAPDAPGPGRTRSSNKARVRRFPPPSLPSTDRLAAALAGKGRAAERGRLGGGGGAPRRL